MNQDVVASGLRRRTVLTGAAWSVPAVVMMSASPAFANSTVGRVTLTSGSGTGFLPSAGYSTIKVTVVDAQGNPAVGESVSLTGPASSAFDAASGITDGTGVFETGFDLCAPWTAPGSTVTLTAVSGTESGSAGFRVLSSNMLGTGWGYGAALRQSARVFPSAVVKAKASWTFSAVLLQDGTVWTIGANDAGQLGDGTTNDRSTWAPVQGVTDATDIAVGEGHMFALTSSGSVLSWGRGASGQLGDGTTTDRGTPAAVLGINDAVKLMAGPSNGWVLRSDGSVWAWGFNHVGQLGNGQQVAAPSPTPSQVVNVSNATDLVCSNWSCIAQLQDGSLVGWGSSGFGQLGDGSTTEHPTPTSAFVGVSNVVKLAAGAETIYALLSDGTVRASGRNIWGQAGDGTTANPLFPQAVSGLQNVTSIVGTGNNAFAVLQDGTLMGWGANNGGGVGSGTYGTDVLTPEVVPLPSGASSVAFLGTTNGFSGEAFGGTFFSASLGPSASSDLALGGLATASSYWGYNFPGNVNDGSANSRWASRSDVPDPDNAWVQVDLGGRHSISKVSLSWGDTYAEEYVLETSLDGATWATAYSTTAGAGGDETVTFPAVTAAVIRMRGIKRHSSGDYVLYSFKVFAS